MCGTYLKTLLIIFIVSMMVFVIPDSFAEECGFLTVDEEFMTLTPTFDSITIDFSLDDIGCEYDIARGFYNFIIIDDYASYSNIIGGALTSYTVSELEPDTEYLIDVSIFYDGVNNSQGLVTSFDKTITTLSELTYPDPCVDIDASYMSLTSTHDVITVDWLSDDICNAPIGFTIVNVLTLDSRPNAPIDNAVSPHNFADLDPVTQYSVTLDVYYLDDAEPDPVPLGTVIQTIDTLAEPLPDCLDNTVQPNVLYMELTSDADSITVDFSPEDIGCGLGNDGLFNFIGIYDGGEFIDFVEGTETSYTFDELEPETEYTIALDLYYGDSASGPYVGDLVQTITTLAEPLPDCLDLTVEPNDLYMIPSPTFNSITIEFFPEDLGCELPGNDELYNFIVIYDDGAFVDSVDGTETSFTIDGLDPETEYYVTLNLLYGDGGPTVGELDKSITTLSEPESCVDLDDSYMTLTPTINSITVNFLADPICGVSESTILFNYVSFYLYNSKYDIFGANSGDVFTDLPSDTDFIVTLDVWHDDFSLKVGSVTKTVRTDFDPNEVPCVALDDYLTLSSTSDSVTVNWSLEHICNIPTDSTIVVQELRLLDYDEWDAVLPSNGFTFLNLESNTEYRVTVFVGYFLDDDVQQTVIHYNAVMEFIYTDEYISINVYPVPPEPVEPVEPGPALESEEESKGGCSGDCTPPTIGLDEDNKRLVDNGFSYNNNPVNVIAWHTPYPLITAIVNQTNTVEIIAYDNGGIFNLDMVQFGLGIEEFGQPLHDVEVLIEVHLEALYSENTVIVEKVVIRDSDNLIDTYSVFAITEPVQCIDDQYDEDCLKVTLQYSYRESTINNMMVVNVADKARNTQNFYLNDGVEVIGESMNPVPFVTLPNKQTNQQTENLTLTLYRTDKINHIWMDGDGIEYLKAGENRFDRITAPEPYTCNDPPLSEINVPTRSNCHFRALTALWDY